MDAQTIFYIVILGTPFLALAIYGIFNRPNVLTGWATVDSHDVETAKFGGRWSHGWNYLITFRFSDGDTLELYTTEEEYLTIKDGQFGILSWDGNQLVEFVPDVP